VGGAKQVPGSNSQQCAVCAALVEQRQAEQQQRQPISFQERFQVRDARWLLSPTVVEVTPKETSAPSPVLAFSRLHLVQHLGRLQKMEAVRGGVIFSHGVLWWVWRHWG
jgi:hypothetical protein